MNPQQAFLCYTLDHLQKRINTVDSKASILIAVEAGLLALVGFVTEKLLPEQAMAWCYLIVGVTTGFAGIVIAFLLQAIRPSRRFFGRSGDLDSLGKDYPELLYQGKTLPVKEEFVNRFSNLNDTKIERALLATIFVWYQLVHRKYSAYSRALVLAKAQIVVSFAAVVVVCISMLISHVADARI